MTDHFLSYVAITQDLSLDPFPGGGAKQLNQVCWQKIIIVLKFIFSIRLNFQLVNACPPKIHPTLSKIVLALA